MKECTSRVAQRDPDHHFTSLPFVKDRGSHYDWWSIEHCHLDIDREMQEGEEWAKALIRQIQISPSPCGLILYGIVTDMRKSPASKIGYQIGFFNEIAGALGEKGDV